LNIVFACSSPKGLTQLDFRPEIRAVKEFESANGINVGWATSGRFPDLSAAVEQGYPAIFYYTGHARAEVKSGVATTYLKLTKADGTADDTPWPEIQRLFSRKMPLIVVLNACDSASNGGHALIPQVVAACLGMSSTRSFIGFRNKASTDIGALLARELMNGLLAADSIDELVATTRREAANLKRPVVDWANYLLYSDDPDQVAELAPEPLRAARFFGDLAEDDGNFKSKVTGLWTKLLVGPCILLILIGLAPWGRNALGLANVGQGQLIEFGLLAAGGALCLFFGLFGLQKIEDFLVMRIRGVRLVLRGLGTGVERTTRIMIRWGARMLALRWQKWGEHSLLRQILARIAHQLGMGGVGRA
jgi:hypothetical protein